MKVLVTGATGFLGGHLVEALVARGDQVRATTRVTSDRRPLAGLPIEWVTGDLTTPETAPRAVEGVDLVIHSAARLSEAGLWPAFERANVDATRWLLHAARAAGVARFVYVSSPSVVAEYRDQVDIDERHPYPDRFLNHYARSKALAEQEVLTENGPGFVTTSVRPRGIWGPRDWAGAFPTLLGKLRRGALRDISGGRRVRASLCYVDNAVDGCLRAATSERAGGQAYFLTDPEPVDIWHLIDRMAAEFALPPVSGRVSPTTLEFAVSACEALWQLPALRRRSAPPISRYVAGMLSKHSTYSIDKARRDLGYAPTVDLDEGLRRLRRWVDDIGGLARYTDTA